MDIPKLVNFKKDIALLLGELKYSFTDAQEALEITIQQARDIIEITPNPILKELLSQDHEVPIKNLSRYDLQFLEAYSEQTKSIHTQISFFTGQIFDAVTSEIKKGEVHPFLHGLKIKEDLIKLDINEKDKHFILLAMRYELFTRVMNNIINYSKGKLNADEMADLVQKSSTVLLYDEEEERLGDADLNYSVIHTDPFMMNDGTDIPVSEKKVFEDIKYFLNKSSIALKKIRDLNF